MSVDQSHAQREQDSTSCKPRHTTRHVRRVQKHRSATTRSTATRPLRPLRAKLCSPLISAPRRNIHHQRLHLHACRLSKSTSNIRPLHQTHLAMALSTSVAEFHGCPQKHIRRLHRQASRRVNHQASSTRPFQLHHPGLWRWRHGRHN